MPRKVTRDHYAILGLPQDAELAEIKAAYRRLARGCHPDLHPGDPCAEEKFKLVSEAYEALRSSRGPDGTGSMRPGAAGWTATVARDFDPADDFISILRLFRSYQPHRLSDDEQTISRRPESPRSRPSTP